MTIQHVAGVRLKLLSIRESRPRGRNLHDVVFKNFIFRDKKTILESI